MLQVKSKHDASSPSGNGKPNADAVAIEDLDALAAFSTPTVANVLALIDDARRVSGFARGRVRAVHRRSKPVVGFAMTATCRSFRAPGEPPASLATDDVIVGGLDLPHPRLFVLQDLESEPRSAVFGEMIATALARFGYAGIITNGACRDIAELRRLRMPCWATTRMAGFAGGGYVDCCKPVHIDGLDIHPGDLIHADVNGIVVVPRGKATQVAAACRRFQAIEDRALARMKQMSNDIDQLREILGELRESLRQLRPAGARTAAAANAEVSIAPHLRINRSNVIVHE